MDWQHTTLGEICELYQPKTISGKDMMSGGRYPVFGANGIIGRYHDFNHEAPQLVIGCRGSVGAVHVTEPYSWITGNSMVVKPKGNQLSVRFVEYYLRGGVDLSPAISGTAQPQITRTSLSPIPISFPPLPEQQRIVTKLDAAFAALGEAEANVERNRANARELFESYLNGVFEGKDGWEERTLGDLGKVCMCKRIMKHQTTSTGDVPFYKIGTFGKAPDAFIAEDIYQEFKKKYSFPKKGDVLISASGTIGRGVVYDGEPAYFQDSNIVWIDNNEEQVLNEYLFHFYKVCNWNPSKGATISRLYNDDLRRIKIAFPDLHEQLKLVEHMVELDERTRLLESTYQQKLDELAALKKGLLGAAFRGEL